MHSALCPHDTGKSNLVRAIKTAEHHGLLTEHQTNSLLILLKQSVRDFFSVDSVPIVLGSALRKSQGDSELERQWREKICIDHGLDVPIEQLTAEDIERISRGQQEIRGRFFTVLKELLVTLFRNGVDENTNLNNDVVNNFIQDWPLEDTN